MNYWVPFYFLYVLVKEVSEDPVIVESNLTTVLFIALGRILVSMLAISGCCRMIKNYWIRLAVIIVHQVVLIASIVRLGAVADNSTFLPILKESMAIAIINTIVSVILLQASQEFAD